MWLLPSPSLPDTKGFYYANPSTCPCWGRQEGYGGGGGTVPYVFRCPGLGAFPLTHLEPRTYALFRSWMPFASSHPRWRWLRRSRVPPLPGSRSVCCLGAAGRSSVEACRAVFSRGFLILGASAAYGWALPCWIPEERGWAEPSQAAPFYFQLSECQPEWPQRPEPSTAQGCQSPSHKAERQTLGFEASSPVSIWPLAGGSLAMYGVYCMDYQYPVVQVSRMTVETL